MERTLLEQNVIYKLSLTEITSLSADYIWTKGRMFSRREFREIRGIIPPPRTGKKPSIDPSRSLSLKVAAFPEWDINPRIGDVFRKTFDTR